ncbi:MAG: hypothetical protein F4029_20755 [Gammaproteobacteria bacterium]|nr:hypothetical protein [Gammaproteobacteria bacterium]MYK48644.1 hypothetical protein [Gammaproteobacteria bacterium]
MTKEDTTGGQMELRMPIEVLKAIPNGEDAIVPLTIKVTGGDARVTAVASDEPSAIRIAKSANGRITLSSPDADQPGTGDAQATPATADEQPSLDRPIGQDVQGTFEEHWVARDAGDRRNHVVRSFRSEAGKLFAEWHLMRADLSRCLETIRLWEQRVEGQQGADLVADSMFRDVVVSFVACFDDNQQPVRIDPDELYGPFEDRNALSYFRWVEALRHSWVAHRTGSLRQAHCTVGVHEGSGDVVFFGAYSAYMTGFNLESGEGLTKLIELALAYTNGEYTKAEEAARREVRALHSSQRLRLPVAAVKVPGPESTRTGRRKYGNMNRMLRRDVKLGPDETTSK